MYVHAKTFDILHVVWDLLRLAIALYAVTQVHTTQLHHVEVDKPTEATLEQLEDEDNDNSTGVY